MKEEEKDQIQEVEVEDSEVVVLEEGMTKAEGSTKEKEDLKSQVTQLSDKLLRSMAEAENMRRRYEKMVEDTREYAIVNFAKDLLGVMDNLSRALAHKPEQLDIQTKGIFEGVVMTKDELNSVFKKHGLQPIEPAPGEKFDYNLHHAISQVATDEYNQDTVVNLMQAGYKMKDRLLRPASVIVSKKPE